jgi:hypothetical protein
MRRVFTRDLEARLAVDIVLALITDDGVRSRIIARLPGRN